MPFRFPLLTLFLTLSLFCDLEADAADMTWQAEMLQNTQGFLDDFAKTGLRTLLIASKEISQEYYQEWSMKYLKAATSVNKEVEMNKVSE